MAFLRKLIGLLFVWTVLIGVGLVAYSFIVLDSPLPSWPSKPASSSVASRPTTPHGPLPAAPLSLQQWAQLEQVILPVPSIEFARGFTLSETAKEELDKLAELLRSSPEYYLRIEGNAKKEGDADANLQLAKKRAAVVRDYLVQEGRIAAHRIQDIAKPPGTGTEVTFIVLQNPQNK